MTLKRIESWVVWLAFAFLTWWHPMDRYCPRRLFLQFLRQVRASKRFHQMRRHFRRLKSFCSAHRLQNKDRTKGCLVVKLSIRLDRIQRCRLCEKHLLLLARRICCLCAFALVFWQGQSGPTIESRRNPLRSLRWKLAISLEEVEIQSCGDLNCGDCFVLRNEVYFHTTQIK